MVNYIPTFTKCFPNCKTPIDPPLYYSNFYKGNDINYQNDVIFIDLRYGDYKIFKAAATITRILKSKELLDILNAPY